jgi:Uncharacterized protein, possibly involved in utilization of glycolate and propanediol
MSGIITTKKLSMAVADEIATFAIRTCKARGFKPISVCVMDSNGYEIVTKRMDGCPPTAYPQIARAKAITCISTGQSSRAYGEKYLRGKGSGDVGPSTFVRLINQIDIVSGNMACFPGGIIVKEASTGDILGSVGISGAAGDEDEYCALQGVQQCSLATQLVTLPASSVLER